MLDDYLARAYFEKRQLSVTMVRLFNTIGVNQVGEYGMVVPRLMSQAMSGTPLTVYGNGKQTRCFTDVRDVVEALLILEDCQPSVGELINLGTNTEISMLELASKIIEICNSRSKIKLVSYEEAYGEGFEDMNRRVASHAKLNQLTEFKFRYRLDDTLQWIRNDLQCDRALTCNTQIAATA